MKSWPHDIIQFMNKFFEINHQVSKSRFFLLLAIAILAQFCFLQNGLSALRCDDLFLQSIKIESEENSVKVNDVLVTDHAFEGVVDSLQIDQALWQRMSSRKGLVVSVGEGISGFLPGLIKRGFQALGVDLWYHRGDLLRPNENTQDQELSRMRQYHQQFSRHLRQGSATALPFKADSVSFLFAHMLANNLHIHDQLKFFYEIVRVLEVNGESSLSLTPSGVYDMEWTKTVPYQKVINDFLTRTFGPNGKNVAWNFQKYNSFYLKKVASIDNFPTFSTEYAPNKRYVFLPSFGQDLTLPSIPTAELMLYYKHFPDDRPFLEEALKNRGVDLNREF